MKLTDKTITWALREGRVIYRCPPSKIIGFLEGKNFHSGKYNDELLTIEDILANDWMIQPRVHKNPKAYLNLKKDGN
jgi:hypothetical protein